MEFIFSLHYYTLPICFINYYKFVNQSKPKSYKLKVIHHISVNNRYLKVKSQKPKCQKSKFESRMSKFTFKIQ